MSLLVGPSQTQCEVIIAKVKKLLLESINLVLSATREQQK